MAYTTRAQITAALPPAFLLQALDDDNNGVEDVGVFDEIVAAAQTSVDGYLGSVVTVPLVEPIPPLAASACRVFVLEALYQRRGYSEDTDPPNPWTPQAKQMRAKLQRIASREEPLSPTQAAVTPGVAVVTEPSRTHSRNNRLGF